MDITMPKLGLTMTEGTIVEWLKQPGEKVRTGETLFVFESEKSVMDYESPSDGILAEILKPVGETVPCGEIVARLQTQDEHATTAPTDRKRGVEEGKNRIEDRKSRIEERDHRTIAKASGSARPSIATPAAKRRAGELGIDITTLTGRGPDNRVQLADVEEAIGEKQDVSPLARKLADDLGLELGRVRGSGPHGRIMRADVVAAARRALTQVVQQPEVGDETSPYVSRDRLLGVREVIARRMSESAFSAPHVTLHTEVDATSLVATRQQLNRDLNGEIKVSYNALLMALLARGLREYPTLNACLVDDEICVYRAVNIALAVDTKRGLLTPVVRDVDRLQFADIQRSIGELVQRALAGKSLPDDFSDGTFTLTNLGMFDIDGFTPVINQPQAAILGVGRIHSRVVDVNGEVALRQMMTLSLSFDHRIVDGGPAAQFLQRIKQLIEQPAEWAS